MFFIGGVIMKTITQIKVAKPVVASTKTVVAAISYVADR